MHIINKNIFKKIIKSQIPLNIIFQEDTEDKLNAAFDEAEEEITTLLDNVDSEKQKGKTDSESDSDSSTQKTTNDKSKTDNSSSNSKDDKSKTDNSNSNSEDDTKTSNIDQSGSGSGTSESSESSESEKQQQNQQQEKPSNSSNNKTLQLLIEYLTEQLKFKKFNNNLKFRKFSNQQKSEAPNSLINIIDLNTKFENIRKQQQFKYFYTPKSFNIFSTSRRRKNTSNKSKQNLNNAYIYFFTFKQQADRIQGHFIECINTSWNHLIDIKGDLSKLQTTSSRN